MGALGLDAVDWAGVSGRYSSFTDAKHNVVQGGCHLALPVGRKRGVSPPRSQRNALPDEAAVERQPLTDSLTTAKLWAWLNNTARNIPMWNW